MGLVKSFSTWREKRAKQKQQKKLLKEYLEKSLWYRRLCNSYRYLSGVSHSSSCRSDFEESLGIEDVRQCIWKEMERCEKEMKKLMDKDPELIKSHTNEDGDLVSV